MKHTKKIFDKTITLASEGHYITTIFQACGLNRDTFYDWKSRGEAGEEPFATWLRRFNQAVAEHEMECSRAILAEGKGSVTLEWLARRHPARWGNRMKIDTETLDAAIELAIRGERMVRTSDLSQNRDAAAIEGDAVSEQIAAVASPKPAAELEDWEKLFAESSEQVGVSPQRREGKSTARRVRRGKDKRGRN